MESITIKPHHLLDIYKLHGTGINNFVPDPRYQHDFYRIGNLILTRQIKSIRFTADADIICTPCIFCQKGICNDTFLHYGTKTIKDQYNRNLDQTIMTLLAVEPEKEYEYDVILNLLAQKTTESFINQIWHSNTKSDNQLRWQNTITGIKKLMEPT